MITLHRPWDEAAYRRELTTMLEAERRARARADERYARRVELWVDAGFVIMLLIAITLWSVS